MTQTPQPASYQTSKNLASLSIFFSWGLILYLVIQGNPSNSLHTSALAWAFSYNLANLAAYVYRIYTKL